MPKRAKRSSKLRKKVSHVKHKVSRAAGKIKKVAHIKIKAAAKKVSAVTKKYKSAVTEFLEKHKVPFEVQPHKKNVWSAEDIARERKVSLSQVVKCLVLTDGTNHVVACVPGDRKVKAGLVKQIVGTGKLEFLHEKHLKKVTGHPLGTTSPVGLASKVPVIIDARLAKQKRLSISSGHKKFGIKISTADLLKASGARVAKISE